MDNFNFIYTEEKSMISWKDEYTTGMKVIDEHHKILFDNFHFLMFGIFNKLFHM